MTRLCDMRSLRLQVLCIEMLCPGLLQQLGQQPNQQMYQQADQHVDHMEDQQADQQAENNPGVKWHEQPLPLQQDNQNKFSLPHIFQNYQQPMNYEGLRYLEGGRGESPMLRDGDVMPERSRDSDGTQGARKVKRRWSDMLKTCVSRMCVGTSGVAKIECSVKHCHYSK